MSVSSGGPGPPFTTNNSNNLDIDNGSVGNNTTRRTCENGSKNMEVEVTPYPTTTAPNEAMVRGNKRGGDAVSSSVNKVHVHEIRTNNKNQPPSKSDYIDKATKNRYRNSDKGPYVVNLEGNKGNLGKLHRMALGKWLFKTSSTYKDEIVDISVTGQNRMKVTTRSPQAANDLLNLEILKEREIIAYIPNFRVQCTGVIRDIDVELEDNEILAELISPSRPISIRRLTRKTYVNNKLLTEKLPVCFINFDSQSLPQYVSLYGAKCKVNPYIPSIRQCKNCLRFRHSEEQCRSKMRCEHCTQNHNVRECPLAEATLPVCIHCNGEHRSTFRDCPVKIMQNNEIKNKILNKSSFAMATKNKFDVLSVSEFPELPEVSPTTSSLRKPPKIANKTRHVNNEMLSKQFRDAMRSKTLNDDSPIVSRISGEEIKQSASKMHRITMQGTQSGLTYRPSIGNTQDSGVEYIVHLIQKINNVHDNNNEIIQVITSNLEEILAKYINNCNIITKAPQLIQAKISTHEHELQRSDNTAQDNP